MWKRNLKKRPRRRARALRRTVVTLVVSSGLVLADAAVAQAVQSYVPCPVNTAGAGCGFEGGVGPGSYIVTYRFKRVSGGFGAETHAFTCPKEYCPVQHYAVKDPDRMPAGFDVSSDALFTSYEEFSW